jgi:hypothetical protein
VPFVSGGVVVGGATSWGVVRPIADSDRWERVCEEAFGPAVFFALDQGERGILLGGTGGMFRTRDGGCTYDPVENGLEGEFVSASWFDPLDPEHMMIGTSTPTSRNGVWESTDGGDTFSELIAPAFLSFFSLAVSQDNQSIAVTGSDDMGTPTVLMSNDGGASFVDVSSLAAPYPIARALIFDGDELLMGGLQPSTQGFVDRVSFDGVAATATRLGDTPREVRQAVIFAGVVFALATNGTRGELFKANGSALGFGVVEGGPSDCVFVRDGVLFGCGKQVALNPFLFIKSVDGTVWTPEVSFADISYQLCPEGTVGRSECGAFVELFCGDGVDNDVGDGIDCEDPDCETNALCLNPQGEGEGEEGEGEEGEGEGEAAEGEGEGEGEGGGASCCTGAPATALVLPLVVLLRRRRASVGLSRDASRP